MKYAMVTSFALSPAFEFFRLRVFVRVALRPRAVACIFLPRPSRKVLVW
jgi:hypothetical protein